MSGVQPLLKAETPQQAARRLFAKDIAAGFKPVALHRYDAAAGAPLFYRPRLRHPDGRKIIKPMRLDGNAYVLGEPKAPETGKPLYRLPELLAVDLSTPVFIAEGESCCDELHAWGITATTSGGCTSADAADWEPLKGRTCIMWADNDEPGQQYARAVVAKLRDIADVRLIDTSVVESLPKHGDCVDWRHEHRGATAADILALPTIAPHYAPPFGSATVQAPTLRTRCIASRRASDIEREEVKWLWPGRFPLGKVSLLVGDPGLGKSLITLGLAATVSRGGLWPIRGEGSAPTGDVVLVSAEDDAGDTVRPRLEAAGADLERIHIIDGINDVTKEGTTVRFPWSLAELPALEQKIAELPGCKLLVIDPVSAYLSGIDSYKNADVRTLLAPLGDLAAKHRMAVVCVSHLNKSQGPAMYRTSGSLAFVAAARSVYVVAKDSEDSDRRLVVPVKSNLAPGSTAVAYRVTPDSTGTPMLEWEPDSFVVDANDALALDTADGGSSTAECADWLRDELANGPMPAKNIKHEAREAGFSEKVLRGARERLKIKPRKREFQGAYVWKLPGNDAPMMPIQKTGHHWRPRAS